LENFKFYPIIKVLMDFLSPKERKKERKCPIESGGIKFLIGLLPKVPFQLEIYLVLTY
jgi:hypothetical protein